MLTKDDFTKLKKIIRDEIETEGESIKTELGHEIKMTKIQSSSDMDTVQFRLKNIEIKTNNIQTNVKKLRKDLSKTIDYFDKKSDEAKSGFRKTREELHLSELSYI